MAGFLDWLARLASAVSGPPKASRVRAQPIAINPGDCARLKQAAYRVDAIRRHIEQSKKISPRRRREFFVETVAHADMLLRAGQIDEAAHDAMIDFVRR